MKEFNALSTQSDNPPKYQSAANIIAININTITHLTSFQTTHTTIIKIMIPINIPIGIIADIGHTNNLILQIIN